MNFGSELQKAIENKTVNCQNLKIFETKFSRISECRAPCLASQALSFESAQSLLALLEQRAHVHLLLSTSPGLAALLRSDGFFSGAVYFVRRTLARSVFHFIVFLLDSKDAKVCKSCRSRQELSHDVPFSQFLFERDSYSHEYLVLFPIYLQKLASIQPRTGLSKVAKN